MSDKDKIMFQLCCSDLDHFLFQVLMQYFQILNIFKAY